MPNGTVIEKLHEWLQMSPIQEVLNDAKTNNKPMLLSK